MGTTPQWITTPRFEVAQLTTANTSRDGTGTIADLIQGSTAGTRLIEVRIKPAGSASDCLVNLFYWNGIAWRFFDDIFLPAASASLTLPLSEASATFSNLLLPSSSTKIGAAITVAPTAPVNIFALGGDL